MMSIAENKSRSTQQYDNYLISNAIMFGETFSGVRKVVDVERGDYAEKFQHSLTHNNSNQKGNCDCV
jgi:hypothetical protein